MTEADDFKTITRRKFLQATAAAGIGTSIPASIAASAPETLTSVETTNANYFPFGVASGDPSQHSIVLWTKLLIESKNPALISWQLARDEHFNDLVQAGEILTQTSSNFTAKVVVQKLNPANTYYYRFQFENNFSRVGKTKTLPAAGVAAFKLAVVSCSNYVAGYFHVYKDVARHADVDLIVHLGDYIYEHGKGGYASEDAKAMAREPIPSHKLQTLDDYRQRYGQYHLDPDLQQLHAEKPFVCIWDDHEIVNGSYQTGAEGLAADKDAWHKQRSAAMQAYHEWLPITPLKPQDRIFRHFKIGELLHLSLLDARHFAREAILPSVDGLIQYTSNELSRRFSNRQVLGASQEDWLNQEIEIANKSAWHMIGQQFLVSQFELPDLNGLIDFQVRGRSNTDFLKKLESFSKLNPIFLNDSWEGYKPAKTRFLETIAKSKTSPIVITGDIHTGLGAEINFEDKLIGFELVTPSVTSPGLDQVIPPIDKEKMREAFFSQNPELRYLDGAYRGWLQLDVRRETTRAQWRYVNNVKSKSFKSIPGKQVVISNKKSASGFKALWQGIS